MKQRFIILLIFTLFTSNLFSQNTLQEFIIEKDNNPQAFYKSQGCTPDDGVIVFNTTIPDLKFNMPDTPNRLKKVTAFDKANSRYVICLQPTDTEIGGIFKYTIDITATGYKLSSISVNDVTPGITKYYKVNPKEDPEKKKLLKQISELEKTKTARQSIFIDLLGPGMLSLNYEYLFRLNSGNKISTGAMVGLISMSPQINYMLGKKSHHFELGGGLGYAYLMLDESQFSYNFRIGYRYQRQRGGFLFRFGLTPTTSYLGDLIPMVGISLGGSF
jgi:hypothetical protein